nr:hypothetical protein [Tanacetum cinerariifolium]
MEKFKTLPNSPPVIVIDPDDQPMWSSTRTVAPTPSSAIIQLLISNNFHIKGTHMQMIRDIHLIGYGLTKRTIIQIFYHGLDDPTQEILDAKGIFLYNTPNKAFKILEDKVLFKLDFSDDSQNNPKPKAIVYASGSDINLDHVILMEKFAALATKIDSEFLIIRKELNKMRDGHRDNYASQIYMNDDTPMQTEANEHMKDQVVELENRIHQGLRNRQAIIENLERKFEFLEKKILRTKSLLHITNTKLRHEFVYKSLSIQNENDKGDDFTMRIPYTNAKTFADVVMLNHVGNKELNAIDGV